VSLSQDSKKKRDEERQKQLRWREEHRNAILQGRDSLDTGDLTNGRLPRELLSCGGGRYTPQLPGYTPASAFPPLVVAGAQAFRQKRWRQSDIIDAGLNQVNIL